MKKIKQVKVIDSIDSIDNGGTLFRIVDAFESNSTITEEIKGDSINGYYFCFFVRNKNNKIVQTINSRKKTLKINYGQKL